MKKLNWILLGGIALACTAEGVAKEMHNVDSEKPKHNFDKGFLQEMGKFRPWGRINYSTLSHFDVTFDQFDLKCAKSAMVDGGLKIPAGVTHAFLKLSGNFAFVEFPESVRFINKDIFKECDVKSVSLSARTVKMLLRKRPAGNEEENIRKYFSLSDSTEIVINSSLNTIPDNFPEPPAIMDPKAHKDNFLDEIHGFDKDMSKKEISKQDIGGSALVDELNKFDRNKLKHVQNPDDNEKDLDKYKEPENPLFKDIQGFDKNQLKHVKSADDNNVKASDNEMKSDDNNKKSENPWLKDIQNFDKSKQLKHRNAPEKRKIADPLAKELLERVPYVKDEAENPENDAEEWK